MTDRLIDDIADVVVAAVRKERERVDTALKAIQGESEENYALLLDTIDRAQKQTIADAVTGAKSAAGAMGADLKALSAAIEQNAETWKVWAEQLKADSAQTIAERHDSNRKDFENALELARLDANLWMEQTRRKVADLDRILESEKQVSGKLQAAFEKHLSDSEALAVQYAALVAETPEHVGGYRKDQTYTKGQQVCRDGATFQCVVGETAVDPRDKTETPHWRLIAARGEKGDRGETGTRGARGQKGEPGKKGADGVSFVGVEMKDNALVLVSSNGDAHRVDLSKMIDAAVEKKVKALEVA